MSLKRFMREGSKPPWLALLAVFVAASAALVHLHLRPPPDATAPRRGPTPTPRPAAGKSIVGAARRNLTRASRQASAEDIDLTAALADALQAKSKGAGRSKLAELRQLVEARRNAAVARAAELGLPTRDKFGGRDFELVEFGADGPVYLATHNVNVAISTGADQVRGVPAVVGGDDVDGDGFTVGIWDSGTALRTHREFDTRVRNMDNGPVTDHATHNAGTIAASGYFVAGAMGLAPAAKVHTYEWIFDTIEMADRGASYAAESGKLAASCHAYGAEAGWAQSRLSGSAGWHWSHPVDVTFPFDETTEDPQFGQYNTTTRSWDLVAHSRPYYSIFTSAGNHRADNPTTGDTVYYFDDTLQAWQTVTPYDPASHPLGDGAMNDGGTNPGFDTLADQSSAKNVITIGSVDGSVTGGLRTPGGATVSTFSGWGPTDDGRVKPDLVAFGEEAFSAQADSLVVVLAGDLEPDVTGSFSLIGSYNGRNYYQSDEQRAGSLWYIWWTNHYWAISDTLGDGVDTDDSYWARIEESEEGSYQPFGVAVGDDADVEPASAAIDVGPILSTDITGAFGVAGTYDTKDYYQSDEQIDDQDWFIWWDLANGRWVISIAAGAATDAGDSYWTRVDADPEGDFNPQGLAGGVAVYEQVSAGQIASITASLQPDVTETYRLVGSYNGEFYYRSEDLIQGVSWYIWWATGSWTLSNALGGGNGGGDAFWRHTASGPRSEFSPEGTAAGLGEGIQGVSSVTIEDTVNPDATGTYAQLGTLNAQPYYETGGSTWFLWWDSTGSAWTISNAAGGGTAVTDSYWTRQDVSRDGDYTPAGVAEGTITIRAQDQNFVAEPRTRPVGDGDVYALRSGTSVAAAGATGSGLLLIDMFEDLFPGQWLRSSALKALLIHTADDLGNAGPDYKYGWGLIDAEAAAAVIAAYSADPTALRILDGRLTADNSADTYQFVWDGSADGVKVTMVWTDPAGDPVATTTTDSATATLVNDLDIVIQDEDPITPDFYPFTLDPANPNTAATADQANHVDNVEQIVIAAVDLTPGDNYVVTVSHLGLLADGEQAYSLVVSGAAAPAEAATPTITGTDPSYVGANSQLAVEGVNFQIGSRVKMTQEGQPDVEFFAVEATPTEIQGRVDLVGVADGMWDVEVTNPDGQVATLVDAFEIRFASLDFGEDFEDAFLDSFWELTSTAEGRIRMRSEQGPNNGLLHLLMDDGVEDDGTEEGDYSLNELVLIMNTQGFENITLSFASKDLGDDNDLVPESFDGSSPGDGVSVSADGITWYRLIDLSVESFFYEQFGGAVDGNITELFSSVGVSAPSRIAIKFQQYDNNPLPLDGIAIDDIVVTGVAAQTSITAANVAVDEGAGTASVAVTLSGTSQFPVSIDYDTAGDSADENVDFVGVNGTLTWAGGQTGVQVVTIPLEDDDFYEPTEALSLLLSNVSNATLTNAVDGVDTIDISLTDNDPLPQVSVANLDVNEDSLTAEVTITLTAKSQSAVSVSFITGDDADAVHAATGGLDYVVTTGTLTWDPLEIFPKTVQVSLLPDTLAEAYETFSITLTDATNAQVNNEGGIVKIIDDDDPVVVFVGLSLEDDDDDDDDPALRIVTDADSMYENGGVITGAVYRENASTAAPLVVDLASDTPAEATVPAQVTIPAGAAGQPFTITAQDDVLADGDQTVTITASSAGLDPGSKAIEVLDDDALVIELAAASMSENGGTIAATLIRPNTSTVADLVVDVESDATAEATVPAQVTIAAGEDRAYFTVTAVDDATADGDQTVTLTASGQGFIDGTAQLQVTDDEAVASDDCPDCGQESGELQVNEGAGAATVTICLVGISAAPVSVSFRSSTGLSASPAVKDEDFTGGDGLLSWDPEECGTKEITVQIVDDDEHELPHEGRITLSFPTNAVLDGANLTLQSKTAAFTIIDNDQPQLSVADVTVDEGVGLATVTVTAAGVNDQGISVNYFTTAQSALDGADYTGVAGVLTWNPGENGDRTFTVPITDDGNAEANEDLLITLGNPVEAGITDGSALLTINDNEASPVITFGAAVQVNEEGVGDTPVNAALTVSMDRTTSIGVTVDYTITGGTATADADYTDIAAGTLQWALNNNDVKQIVIATIPDTVLETNETIIVTLSNPQGATLGDASGTITSLDNTITIIDNDPLPVLDLADVQIDENDASGVAQVTVTMTGAREAPVTVDYTVGDGTAKVGLDYHLVQGQLGWGAGETGAKTFDVPIIDDDLVENIETIDVSIFAVSNAAVATAASTISIVDDDVNVVVYRGTTTERRTGGNAYQLQKVRLILIFRIEVGELFLAHRIRYWSVGDAKFRETEDFDGASPSGLSVVALQAGAYDAFVTKSFAVGGDSHLLEIASGSVADTGIGGARYALARVLRGSGAKLDRTNVAAPVLEQSTVGYRLDEATTRDANRVGLESTDVRDNMTADLEARDFRPAP